MNTNEAQQEAKFKISLNEFQIQNNIKKKEAIDGDFHDFRLYKLICRRGGSQAVTNRRQWPEIAQQLGVRDIAKMKAYYLKFIHPYELKYYFGKQEQQELPSMLGGLPRKMIKTQGRQKQGQPVQQQQIQVQKNDDLTYQQQLAKHFEEQQKNKRQFFLKKKKLTHTKAEGKKIILGLESFMDKTETIYSLNMLLLYSFNIQQPFLFEHHQKIFNALSSYTHSLYPPKDEQDLENLRMATLILRNLTFFPKNLKFMLGTKLFNLLVTIFNTGLDTQQCSKNIADIMNGLVKVGWNCDQIIKELNQAILDQKIEDVQSSIQMLRALVDEREDALIEAVISNLHVFARVLISNQVSVEVKQQVVEIFSFVTDASGQAKTVVLKNQTVLGIIVGILLHMRNHQKLAQFAALTLNNIASVTGSTSYLKHYQSQLLTIGFTDDSLAGIIANILSDIAHG